MVNSLLRTDNEIEMIYRRHVKTVYWVCFTHMKNSADTDDAVSDTFFKMIKASPHFESQEHEKVWLIRTATNVCKDILKHWWRRRETLEDYSDSLHSDGNIEIDDTLEEICRLPDKYKVVICLYYYEGYNAVEISKILKRKQSTIRYYLREAKTILNERLGGFNEEQ